MRTVRNGFLITLLMLTIPVHGDVITDWNKQILESIRSELTNPPQGSRILALVNTAMYDAVNGVLGGYEPYHVTATRPNANAAAAAAAAAHRVLVELYPSRTAIFNAALSSSLAEVENGAIQEISVSWGKYCAEQILALRAEDNADLEVSYEPSGVIGYWEPTPEAYAPALQPNWPRVTPWIMARGSQFRSPPPPPLTSDVYTEAFNEVKALGGVDSTERTPDQTEIAWFWADDPGTVGAPGRWILIGLEVSAQQGLSLQENARLFALLSLALADAAIVAWENKYYYDHWRPHYGIHQADQDGNPDTIADPEWQALIPIPPFPGYTSGHSTFSGSGAKVLELFFGTDNISFSSEPEGGVPASTRSFTSFSQAADESGKSRIYGGSHWEHDNHTGLFDGRSLASYIVHNHLRPLGDLSLDLNRTMFDVNGGRLQLMATLTPSIPGQRVDAYVALESPAGDMYFLQADGSVNTTANPIARDVPTVSASGEVFSINLAGAPDMPVGTYVWMAVLTNAGSQQPASNVASVAFNYNPYSEQVE